MFRLLRWRSEGDWILHLIVWMTVIVSAAQSSGQEEFTIHKAEVVAQSPPKDSREMDFSISKQETTRDDEELIGFSVHNAKAPPKPTPKPDSDVGDAKPSCSEARQVNRALLIVDTSKRKEERQVQICPGKGKPCVWIMQTIEVVHLPSQSLMKEAGKLDKGWRVGDDECVHFKVVEFTDPRNADMVRELRVDAKDLPLLIKETRPDTRKKVNGMNAKALMDLWNKWFLEPVAEGKEPAAKCVPGVGDFIAGPQWDYAGQGSLRQHLTDPRGLHHLPLAVVNQWSDAQVQAWHNWHHEAMKGNTVKASSQNASSQPRASTYARPVSLGYSQGSFQGNVAQFALSVAQTSARSPPSQSSFSNDPKKAAKAQKKWKHDERERIRKEVSRAVWQQYSTFDPFTILTIISVLIRVLSFVFQMYGLN